MKSGIIYDQGDIVLIPFPYTDLTGLKKRPAIVISNKLLNNSEDRICCLITSNEPIDSGILIEKDCLKDGSLPFKSWVKPHRIFTINKKIVDKKLCSVSKEFHGKIVNSINEFIN